MYQLKGGGICFLYQLFIPPNMVFVHIPLAAKVLESTGVGIIKTFQFMRVNVRTIRMETSNRR